MSGIDPETKTYALHAYTVGRDAREFIQFMHNSGLGDLLSEPVVYEFLIRCSDLTRKFTGGAKNRHDLGLPTAIFVHEKVPQSCPDHVIENFPYALKFILSHRYETKINNDPLSPHIIDINELATTGIELIDELDPLINLFMITTLRNWQISHGFDPDEE